MNPEEGKTRPIDQFSDETITFLKRLVEGLAPDDKEDLARHDLRNIINILSVLEYILTEGGDNIRKQQTIEGLVESLELLYTSQELEGVEGGVGGVAFAKRLVELLLHNNAAFARIVFLTAEAIEHGVLPEGLEGLRVSLEDVVKVFVPSFKISNPKEQIELGWREVVVVWNSLLNARAATLKAGEPLVAEFTRRELQIINSSTDPLPEDLGRGVLRREGERVRYGAYLARKFAEFCGIGLRYNSVREGEIYQITTTISFPNV